MTNSNKEEAERPLNYFLRMLLEGQLDFIDLTRIYVTYLEHLKDKHRKQMVETAVLLSVFEKPKLWQGTKEELKKRVRQAIEAAKVF